MSQKDNSILHLLKLVKFSPFSNKYKLHRMHKTNMNHSKVKLPACQWMDKDLSPLDFRIYAGDYLPSVVMSNGKSVHPIRAFRSFS
jgi:hypothetical protein